MKKILLSIILALPLCSMAQISFTPEGITTDDGKGYYIYEHEGTQTDLYALVKSSLQKTFKNPQKVLSYDEPNSITITAMTDITDKFGMKETLDAIYSMVIQFKDGKVRFNAPNLEYYKRTFARGSITLYPGSGKSSTMSNVYYMYKPDGKPNKKNAIDQANAYFNSLISTIIHYMDNGSSTSDDW